MISVAPGVRRVVSGQESLPDHVLAGEGPKVIEGSSTVNLTDWTTVSILSNCLITRPKQVPTAVETRAGNTEKDIEHQHKGEGGRVPNLRGASPFGRDGGGRSYAARTDGGEETSGCRSGRGGIRHR